MGVKRKYNHFIPKSNIVIGIYKNKNPESSNEWYLMLKIDKKQLIIIIPIYIQYMI